MKQDSRQKDVLQSFDDTVEAVTKKLDAVIAPSRTTVAKRYPTLFTLLATFGVAATFLGFEQLLLTFEILERYPLVLFLIGVGILALTGTLYKKLN